MGGNANLNRAKSAKNDEFYTQVKDIENELVNYRDHLAGKRIYCPCDDYRFSNFWKFFVEHFQEYRLKSLTATNYDIVNGAYVAEYDGYEVRVERLDGDGDFRSDECIEFLKEADIVVTNPPFSLFREYVAKLMEYDKKFIILGNPQAITYKEVFPLIKEYKLWIGVTPMGTDFLFSLTDEYAKEIMATKKEHSGYRMVNGKPMGKAQACWFTNVEHSRRNAPLDLYKKYNPTDYPKYDNYDAIEVSKVAEIPMDYDGVMGVPITFLDKYCPEQFEIVGMMSGAKGDGLTNGNDGRAKFYVNDKGVYARILIKRK